MTDVDESAGLAPSKKREKKLTDDGPWVTTWAWQLDENDKSFAVCVHGFAARRRRLKVEGGAKGMAAHLNSHA